MMSKGLLEKLGPRVVLDTSTIVSAFFWKGNESSLFKRIEEGQFHLFLTKEILDEVADVITRTKFKDLFTQGGPEEIIEKLISLSEMVNPTCKINICRDPNDNKFLECANEGDAQYLVSGDKDLLVLKKFKNTKIVCTSELLESIC